MTVQRRQDLLDLRNKMNPDRLDVTNLCDELQACYKLISGILRDLKSKNG